MTLRSMTGFARSAGGHGAVRWHWELRSVNGRGLDVRLRVPAGFEALEPAIRERVGQRLARGSISISLSVQRDSPVSDIRLNEELLGKVLAAIDRIRAAGDFERPRPDGLLGLRGVALSAPAGIEPNFDRYKPWIRRVLQTLIHGAVVPLVNVNFPREPRGLLWTRTSVRRYDGLVVPTTDPQGRELYWFTVTPIDGADEGTDRWAVEQNWISLTPLRLDLTDEQQLDTARERWPLDEATASLVSPPQSSAEAAKVVIEDESPTTIAKIVATGHGG